MKEQMPRSRPERLSRSESAVNFQTFLSEITEAGIIQKIDDQVESEAREMSPRKSARYKSMWEKQKTLIHAYWGNPETTYKDLIELAGGVTASQVGYIIRQGALRIWEASGEEIQQRNPKDDVIAGKKGITLRGRDSLRKSFHRNSSEARIY
jgi:hypothetical protein